MGPEGKEEVQEGGCGGVMDLANLFGCVWGYDFDVRLDGGEEIKIERGDKIVVKPLLAGL